MSHHVTSCAEGKKSLRPATQDLSQQGAVPPASYYNAAPSLCMCVCFKSRKTSKKYLALIFVLFTRLICYFCEGCVFSWVSLLWELVCMAFHLFKQKVYRL